MTLIVTLSVAYVSYAKSIDTYSSTSTMYLELSIDSLGRIPFDQIQAGPYLLKDYKELIRSKYVMQEVKNNLLADKTTESDPKKLSILEMSINEMIEQIVVSVRNDTRILEITCIGQDPEICAILSNTTTDVFKEVAFSLLKRDIIKVISTAEVPKAPLPNSNMLLIAMTFFLSFMSGLGISLFIEFFSNKIIYPEDLIAYSDVPFLGTIPKLNTPKHIQKSTSSPLLNLCELENKNIEK